MTKRNRTHPLRDRSLSTVLMFGLTVPGCAFAATAGAERQGPVQPIAEATPSNARAAAAPSARDPLKSPYPAQADGQGPRTGPNYTMLRGAEDWRFLANPKAKRDWASPLKYIALDDEGYISLSLNGDQRTSVSVSTRPLLSDSTDRIEILSRTTLGADLRIGPAVRVYGELASGHISGKNETRHLANFENDLVVQQLFAEVRAPVASGVARVTVGRQEFFDGPRFIISPRDNPNIRVSMNGARLSMDWKRFRFSAFYFEPTDPGNGFLDDGIGNGETLTGAYGSFLLTGEGDAGKGRIFFDPFYYNFEDTDRKLGPISGKDRRETYGARLWGSRGNLSFDWAAIKQDGRFAGRRVDAWAVSTNQSLGLGKGKSAPRLGFHADYASGGGTYDGAGKVGSFNFLYNATVIFSDDNFVGAINTMGFAPTISFSPTRRLQVSAEWGSYWRPNENDAAYRGNAQAYAGTQNVAGKHVANIARLKANWSLNPHVALAGMVNYADAGKVLRRAGYGDNLFVKTMLTLRF
ncbi:alginate export family protein [Novosphingobium sp. PP1Y]|uniref:alginate export family protein n=1 Tax=Novosphingobium sp. PP1Y TaxID=702113 RepID=UPI001E4E2DF8|nr:alginate export family protein [Novosphingobium sp. PP1Y]